MPVCCAVMSFCDVHVAAVCEAIKAVCQFSHQLSDTIVFGFATSHTASIEAGEGLCLYLLHAS